MLFLLAVGYVTTVSAFWTRHVWRNAPGQLDREDCTPRKVTNPNPFTLHHVTQPPFFQAMTPEECKNKCENDVPKTFDHYWNHPRYIKVYAFKPNDAQNHLNNCRCVLPPYYWVNMVNQFKEVKNEACTGANGEWCIYPVYCNEQLHWPNNKQWLCPDGSNDCDTQYLMSLMTMKKDDAEDFCAKQWEGHLASVPDRDTKNFFQGESEQHPWSLLMLGTYPGAQANKPFKNNDGTDWVDVDGWFNGHWQPSNFIMTMYTKGKCLFSEWTSNVIAPKEYAYPFFCSRTNPIFNVNRCVLPEEEHQLDANSDGIIPELDACHFGMTSSCTCMERCQEDDDHLSFEWKEGEAPNCCCYVNV